MSQITFPDKQEYDGNDPPDGSMQLTPANVNEIKAAVNSKEDAANKAIDFAVVNNTKFPTTAAVAAYLGGSKFLVSTIDGTEVLNTFKQQAFYSPDSSWSVTTNSSFPLGTSTPKGFLVVFNSNNHVIQRFMTVSPDTNTVSREFVRTFDNDYSAWGKWVELSGSNSIVQNLNSPNSYETASTQAIYNFVDKENTFKLLGDIGGNEDLNTLDESGFYVPASFSQQHTSYPTNVEPPLLQVFTNGDVVVQTLMTLETSTKVYRRYFDGSAWSQWTIINGGGSSSFAWGTPTLALAGSPAQFTVAPGSSSIAPILTDIGGCFRVTRDSAGGPSYLDVEITPSAAMPFDVSAASLTPASLPAWQAGGVVKSVSNTKCIFTITPPAGSGDYFEFFFTIQLDR